MGSAHRGEDHLHFSEAYFCGDLFKNIYIFGSGLDLGMMGGRGVEGF
jgi:hypothetical protein